MERIGRIDYIQDHSVPLATHCLHMEPYKTNTHTHMLGTPETYRSLLMTTVSYSLRSVHACRNMRLKKRLHAHTMKTCFYLKWLQNSIATLLLFSPIINHSTQNHIMNIELAINRLIDRSSTIFIQLQSSYVQTKIILTYCNLIFIKNNIGYCYGNLVYIHSQSKSSYSIHIKKPFLRWKADFGCTF